MIKVLLYKPKKGHEWWWAKLIHAVTGSWYYHAALWIDGYIYEEAAYFNHNKWVSGVRKYKSVPNGDVFVLKPEVIIDEAEVKEWAEVLIKNRAKYNFPLLIAMPIIYPLRWLWRILGWSPFEKAVFGYICSEFVDLCLIQGGVDLLPDDEEYYTTPGDLAESELLTKETT